MYELPNSTSLTALGPLPLFPVASAPFAFRVDSDAVGQPALEVCVREFQFLERLGYRAVGATEDREEVVQALGYSSASSSVWIVWQRSSLSVLITPIPAGDPNLPQHLNRCLRDKLPVVGFGSFPIRPEQIGGCASEFNRRFADLLIGGSPDMTALKTSVDAALREIGANVRRAQARNGISNEVRRGHYRRAAGLFESISDDLTAEERKQYDRVKLLAADERPLLERGSMSYREWIAALERLVNDCHDALEQAIPSRFTSPQAEEAWSDAAGNFHEACALFSDAAPNLDRVRSGDRGAIEAAITFLEVDPWCFGSGYAKQAVLREIRTCNLDESQIHRMHDVLLHLVDKGDRREFRYACRVARHIADDNLQRALVGRVQSSPDFGIQRRALWMLAYVNGSLPPDRTAVHRVLLRAAEDPDWFRVSRWVTNLTRKYGDEEFFEQLITNAGSDDFAISRPALRILSAFPDQKVSAAARSSLESALIRAVKREWQAPEIIEGLAVLVDHPALSAQLTELMQTSQDPDVRRFARWAVNATKRYKAQAPDL